MSEIRNLLKNITAPASPYQKQSQVCRVRDFGSTYANGIEKLNSLVFNIEPIDDESFNPSTYYLNIKDGSNTIRVDIHNKDNPTVSSRVSGVTFMTDTEVELSKQNWLFNVPINPDPTLLKTDEGLWIIPDIDSYVTIGWLNESDAYITQVSKASSAVMKKDGTEVTVDAPKIDFSVNNKKIQLLLELSAKLRNEDTYIEINPDYIDLTSSIQTGGGNGLQSSIQIGATGGILLNGNNQSPNSGGVVRLELRDSKIDIRNEIVSLKDVLLNLATYTRDSDSTFSNLFAAGLVAPSGGGAIIFTGQVPYNTALLKLDKDYENIKKQINSLFK